MSDITTKDILAWLDMQRDAVNTEIVFAAQTEKKQYHKHLEIINALTERVNEMTAVEFARTVFGAWHSCYDDDFAFAQIVVNKLCEDPNVAVEIVKKWKEEQDGH